MKDIENVEAYGRNGYFWLKELEVGQREVQPPTGGPRTILMVDFFSKIRTRRSYKTSPPIQFVGGKKEMIRLFSQVLKELKKL